MKLPRDQESIRAKCFHPSGTFVEFSEGDIDQSITQRFERIVALHPQRTAVKTPAKHISYEQLNCSANRLARTILAGRALGQEPVGVYLKDGVNLITAHLAILKAGKFSFGLDPSSGRNRTEHLLKDSRAAVVITDSETDALANEWVNRELSLLINMNETRSSVIDDNLGISISPHDYSHLRYTSGSTGHAKGGVKTHRHILHAVMNATNSFHISAADKSVLLSRNSSFGKYAFEVLLNGATLYPFYIAEEGLFRLSDWITQEQISLYYSFPTAFRQFMNTLPNSENFPSLRLIRLEGEPVYQSDIDQYKRRFASNCVLVNSFSSTETGPISLYFLDKDSAITGTSIPAGYLVDGMDVAILDPSGKQVEGNESGEIVVRSQYLSSGYWLRPELTRSKFVQENQKQEVHTYPTGDLGQFSEGGCLNLLGRKDFQVKIRSFRVDVGEVEAVLAIHPAIKEVVVVGKTDLSGVTRLIAYYVPRTQSAPTTSVLRAFLMQRLPDYMVPSVFVLLDKLPLLSTGKVNRQALPEPERGRPLLDTPYVPARTSLEIKVSEIWSNVLSRDPVGILDNFFDLGGNSLTASGIASRIFQQFKVEISLEALFQAPTVAEMAALIGSHQEMNRGAKALEEILSVIELMSDEEASARVGENPPK
ncbi:MAG: non-ribosomal peptide synthetase [Chloroflexota bacterium]